MHASEFTVTLRELSTEDTSSEQPDPIIDLTDAALAADVATRTRGFTDAEVDQARTAARWETKRPDRGVIHWLAVSCPFFGPVLVGIATAVWIYVLLTLVRHLVTA